MSLIRIVISVLLIMIGSSMDIFLTKAGIIPFDPSTFIIPLFFILVVIETKLKGLIESTKNVFSNFLLALVFLSLAFGLVGYVENIYQYIGLALMNFLFYILLYAYFKKVNFKEIEWIMTLSFLVLSFSVFYDFQFGLGINENLRKGGFADNSNLAAAKLKFLAVPVLYIYRGSPKRKWILAILIGSILLTFSRGGLLGIVIIIGLLSFNDWSATIKSVKGSKVIKSFCIIGVAYLFLYLVLSILKENVPEMREGALGNRVDMFLGKSDLQVVSDSDKGEHGRYDILQESINKFVENPMGHGTGYTSDRKYSEMSTHNYFLKIGIEYGIIGLLVLYVFLWLLLIDYRKTNNFYYRVGLVLLLIELVLSHSLFDNRSILLVMCFFGIYSTLKSEFYRKQLIGDQGLNKQITKQINNR